MASRISTETQMIINPARYAVNDNSKLLTPIKGEPPVNMGRGRRRNPVVTKMYNQMIMSKSQWFHVNVPITSDKQLASIRASLYARSKKDNLTLSTASTFNDTTKMYDLWIMLS